MGIADFIVLRIEHDEHSYISGVVKQTLQEYKYYQFEEGLVVEFTHTVVEPFAVVVELLNASVALTAVLSSD